jgi:hypothetical protein
VDRVSDDTPRVLINREKVGSFDFHPLYNYRDVPALGLCDEVVFSIVDKLGWRDELDVLISSFDNSKNNNQNNNNNNNNDNDNNTTTTTTTTTPTPEATPEATVETETQKDSNVTETDNKAQEDKGCLNEKL